MISLCFYRTPFPPNKQFLCLRSWSDYGGARKVSEKLVKGNRVDCDGRWKGDVCQQQKYRCMLLSWSVPQNTVNLEINQICYVPCWGDSRILLMTWDSVDIPGLTKDYREWWLKILVWYLYTLILRVLVFVYQFAWKSHLTLQWILFTVVGYVNFMYLFNSLVAGFSYQDVALFWSTFKTTQSSLLASEWKHQGLRFPCEKMAESILVKLLKFKKIFLFNLYTHTHMNHTAIITGKIKRYETSNSKFYRMVHFTVLKYNCKVFKYVHCSCLNLCWGKGTLPSCMLFFLGDGWVRERH